MTSRLSAASACALPARRGVLSPQRRPPRAEHAVLTARASCDFFCWSESDVPGESQPRASCGPVPYVKSVSQREGASFTEPAG